jgi:hypothetical protein
MVVLRNLRLPELDKNRNVDQQQALIFDADSCKYNVILGADFLSSKTGIDVKNSIGTIEWFCNELPLRDTHYLQSKDFLAMAETIEIQLEDDFLAWIGMIQPVMHLKVYNFLEQQGLSGNALCSRKRCHLLKFYTYNLQKPT